MEAAARGRRRRAVAVGPEHDARRRVRALHRPRPARRAAGRRRPQDSRLHAAAEADDAPHLGHHRTRAAAVPPQPDADRHVDDHAARAARRARLRLRRQRQAPEGRRSSTRTTACRPCSVRELAAAVAAGARTFDTVAYADQGEALTDLRNGRVNGVLTIPPEFSRRVLGEERAARRADRGQHRQLRVGDARRRRSAACCRRYNQPAARAARVRPTPTLDVVEVYPVRAVHPVPAARARS